MIAQAEPVQPLNFPRIAEIQTVVCNHFDLTHMELISERRHRELVRPRQIAMYLAKQLTLRSLPEIGRHFGGRDHTTVIHAIRTIERLRGEDADIALNVERCAEEVGRVAAERFADRVEYQASPWMWAA